VDGDCPAPAAAMSWYQSLAGAQVRVAARDRRRIGLDGVGAEDLGVIGNAAGIAELLRLGLTLGAVNDEQIEDMTEAPHGTTGQVKAVNALARQTMAGLAEQVEARVATAMVKVVPALPKSYGGFRDWAERDGWEFPVWQRSCGGGWHGLSMTGGQGLTVLHCPVATIPGPIGEVLAAFVEWLCVEALKSTGLELIEYRLEMIDLPYMTFTDDEVARIAALEGDALTEWAQSLPVGDPDHLEWWIDMHGGMEVFAEILRNLVCGRAEWCKKLIRVNQGADSAEQRLARIRAQAEKCAPCELRDLVLRASEALGGPCTRDYLDMADRGEDFERLPGESAVVDFGMDIGCEDQLYQEQNESLWNGEDVGSMPLNMPHDAMIGMLARITLCERLLVLLTAILEDSPAS
ncbi:MAG TPA: hypothetical protein PKZ76_17605, partial [Xanthomonadaceae bacterium]|nr:hypothetical protein [Xanthomonadaceae bacterium]